MYQFYARLSDQPKTTPKKTIPEFVRRQYIPKLDTSMSETKQLEIPMEIEKKEDEKLPMPVMRENGKFASADGIKKPKKKKPEWDETYSLISINAPVPFFHKKMKKRFFISFVYKKDDQIHKKTVKFGKIGVLDYIDHKDKAIRDKVLSQMKNYYNPFKSNYWRFHLLNQCPSMEEAYLKLLKEKSLIS